MAQTTFPTEVSGFPMWKVGIQGHQPRPQGFSKSPGDEVAGTPERRRASFLCEHYIMPGGGNSAYEMGGDARRKFWIKPLLETDLGVAQAFLTLKRDHVKTQTI